MLLQSSPLSNSVVEWNLRVVVCHSFAVKRPDRTSALAQVKKDRCACALHFHSLAVEELVYLHLLGATGGAPVAERGVRSLKGLVSTQILELRESGVKIPDGDELHQVLGMLFTYAAHCHNHFQVFGRFYDDASPKGEGPPRFSPQLTYPFGTVVFAKVSKST